MVGHVARGGRDIMMCRTLVLGLAALALIGGPSALRAQQPGTPDKSTGGPSEPGAQLMQHRALLLKQCTALAELPDTEAAKLPINVVKWGTAGRPVFIVHGGTQGVGDGPDDFVKQKVLAEQGWRLLLPERPGFGQSPSRGPDNQEAEPVWIAGMLEDGAHLIGHSWGGNDALLAAARRPTLPSIAAKPSDSGFAYSRNFFESLVDSALAHAKKLGATDAGAEVSEGCGLSVSVRNGELENVERNRDKSLGVTVYVGQRRGNASTSDFSQVAIAQTVQAAFDIARFTAEDPFASLPDVHDICPAKDRLRALELFFPWEIDSEGAANSVAYNRATASANESRRGHEQAVLRRTGALRERRARQRRPRFLRSQSRPGDHRFPEWRCVHRVLHLRHGVRP